MTERYPLPEMWQDLPEPALQEVEVPPEIERWPAAIVIDPPITPDGALQRGSIARLRRASLPRIAMLGWSHG